jgi:hypothetical protein
MVSLQPTIPEVTAANEVTTVSEEAPESPPQRRVPSVMVYEEYMTATKIERLTRKRPPWTARRAAGVVRPS